MAESQKYIEDCIYRYRQHGIGRLALIEKRTGCFIGWSGLRLIDDYTFNNQTNFFDVGYRILPEYWGKGYATESGKAAVDFGFNQLNINTIYGISNIKNIASQKALLKIGLNFVEDFKYTDGSLLKWYEIKNK